jgi:hypothetical protein
MLISLRLRTNRPSFAIKDKQIPSVLQAIITLIPIYILKTVYQTIVNDTLLIPKTLCQRWILLVYVFNVKFIIIFILYINKRLRYNTKLILEFSL